MPRLTLTRHLSCAVLLALVLLGGCQRASVDVDLAELTRVPNLPVPDDWYEISQPWTTQSRAPAVLGGWVTTYGSEERVSGPITVGDHDILISATRFATARAAQRSLRETKRDWRWWHKGQCRPAPAHTFVPESDWPDAMAACEHLELVGAAVNKWQYRNITVQATVWAQYQAPPPDFAALFGAIDAHLRDVLLAAPDIEEME